MVIFQLCTTAVIREDHREQYQLGRIKAQERVFPISWEISCFYGNIENVHETCLVILICFTNAIGEILHIVVVTVSQDIKFIPFLHNFIHSIPTLTQTFKHLNRFLHTCL